MIHLLDHLATTRLGTEEIRKYVEKDPILAQVKRCVLDGSQIPTDRSEFAPYRNRVKELSVLQGCLLWGSRMVIPEQCRSVVLQDLHEMHQGTSKMKALARSYVWWPGVDKAVEDLVQSCEICQEVRGAPPSVPLHPWEWTTRPWSRIHLDFAGPFLGHMFLVIIDSHSKWIDVQMMKSITSAKTIEKLRIVFANHGLPRKVVTDNGPTFTSEEFRTFLNKNGIQHSTSAPYHPSSNGLAEKAVQITKHALRCGEKGESIQDTLSRFLFMYRITPHTTTGTPPAELLMGRRLRSRLDMYLPNVEETVVKHQSRQKVNHDRSGKLRMFDAGDKVWVRNFQSPQPKWLKGMVAKSCGDLSYVIELENKTQVRRHTDHVRLRKIPTNIREDEAPVAYYRRPMVGNSEDNSNDNGSRTECSQPVLRRSSRTVRPPDRFGDPLLYH